MAGAVRGKVVREFHVLGDAVNVAARLEAKAPLDAIRADEDPRRRAQALRLGPGAAPRVEGWRGPSTSRRRPW
jgi:class 3 adenylate cyclase